MKVLSREELTTLIGIQQDPSVSIYMPTHRSGDTDQDPIKLRNLLRQAENHLVKYGLRSTDAKEILVPVRKLLPDPHFWQHQGDGLALFFSKGIFKYYQLPRKFQELVVVTERFHIKPLLPLFSQDGIFYVLAISQNQVRLFQCSRFYVQQITPEEVPSSLSEALKYDQPEKQLQFHSGEQGGGAAIFHGHGTSKNYDKSNILRFFHKVDRGLGKVLREEKAPLVIAAVDYLHPIYRKANSYKHLTDKGITGNPDEASEKELQEKAWAIVGPYFEKGRVEKLNEYHEATTPGLAIDDVKRAAEAAYNGQISTLFVASGIQQWGLFDGKSRTVRLYNEEKPGTQDILDFTAVHTLARGGAVYVLEPDLMPGKTSVAALLRYAQA